MYVDTTEYLLSNHIAVKMIEQTIVCFDREGLDQLQHILHLSVCSDVSTAV